MTDNFPVFEFAYKKAVKKVYQNAFNHEAVMKHTTAKFMYRFKDESFITIDEMSKHQKALCSTVWHQYNNDGKGDVPGQRVVAEALPFLFLPESESVEAIGDYLTMMRDGSSSKKSKVSMMVNEGIKNILHKSQSESALKSLLKAVTWDMTWNSLIEPELKRAISEIADFYSVTVSE